MWSNPTQESNDDKCHWMLLEAKPLDKKHGKNGSGDEELQ